MRLLLPAAALVTLLVAGTVTLASARVLPFGRVGPLEAADSLP